MHHLYPATKTGKDPLCPLGFHPQVRWPTRCKRCFRDYKEHGGNRKDEPLRRDDAVTASTPSLPSSWTSQQAQRSRESSSSSGVSSDSSSLRSRTTSSSSSDLTRSDGSNDLSVKPSTATGARPGRPTIWTSTPDLNSLDEDTTSVTIRMPLRSRARVTPTPTPTPPPKEDTSKNTDSDYRSSQYAFRRRTTSDLPDKKTDAASAAAAASAERIRARKPPAPPVKEPEPKKRPPQPPSSTAKSTSTNPEVEFILRVKSSNAANSAAAKKSESKSSKDKKASSSSSSEEDDESDDSSSMAGTETTETTIIDQRNDEEVMELKRELDVMRARCEKLERDKSDILLRRLAGARETAPSSAEALKLQQRVHELQQASEDMRDEKHSLALRVKELEEQVDLSSSREPELRRTVEELRNKLSAAETLCEELMDENEEVKKEIRDLEEEIDEMQDNFREEQADEYTSLKKELEQTAKNCRILQFKLRKSERKAETLELAKQDAERHLGEKGANVASTEKMRALEKEVKLQSEVSERLQKEVEDLKSQLAKEKAAAAAAAKAKSHSVTDKLEVPVTKKKPPMLGKSASGEPVTRASLTRGGSQDDPVQLLRDLQDSMEREADLREQLRFAEEEVWARFLHNLIIEVERQDSILHEDILLVGNKPIVRREDGDGMESDQDIESLALDPSESFEVESEQDIVLDMSESYNEETDSINTDIPNSGDTSILIEEISEQCNQLEKDILLSQSENSENSSALSSLNSYEVLSEQIKKMEALVTAFTETGAINESIKNSVAELSEALQSNILSTSQATVAPGVTVMSCMQTDENVQHAVVDISHEIDIQLEQDAVTILKDIAIEELHNTDNSLRDVKKECNLEPAISPSSNKREENISPISQGDKREESISPINQGDKSSMEVALYSPYIPPISSSSRCEQLVPLVPLTWVPMGSVLPTPRATPSFAVFRPGTPVAAGPGELMLGNLHMSVCSEASRVLLCSQGQNFRKKCSRLEDDNDSLAMQLKKMATKARTRRHSPSPARLTPEPTHEKDEGISDDEDPAELRLQLELNEQESVVLRRKVEDLEKAGETARRQVKDLQDKLASKASSAPLSPRAVRSDLRPASSSAAVLEKKITVLEEEASELRKKLIEKEREYERLQAELTIAQKRSKSSMSRSRSLDGSEQALDLKRQLQVIEQEAVVLRTRTQELEADNDKLSAENKKLSLRAASRSRTPAKEDSGDAAELKEKVATLEKQLTEANNKVNEMKAKKPLPPGGAAAELEKLKTQFAKIEKENNVLKEGGLRLRTRTPKKPTDLTTKLQMKKMVEDLEGEVAELLVGLSKASPDTSTAKASDPAVAKELEEVRKERDKLKKDIDKEKSAFEKEKTKSESELKRLTTEKTKAQENLTKLESENKTLKADIDKLKTSKDLAKTAQEEISKLKCELEEARAVASALGREQEERASEEAKKSEAEKTKLQKEIADKSKKLAEAEKKAKDTDDKLKKTERILSGKKEKLTKAEKDLEAEREKLRQSEVTQKEVSVGWLRERDELKASVTELTRKADQLQEQLSGRVREVEALEGSLTSERARVAELKSSSESSLAATSAAVEKQLEAAREELATAKSRATDLAAQLEKAEKAKKSADDKARKEITDLQSKLSDVESGRTADVKKLELQVKEKEQEVRSLNNQLKTAQQDTGSSSKRIAELQEEFNKKMQKLEQDLSAERQEYEELTARYELLEEEHVVTKAQLTMDRDKAESAVEMSQQELGTLEGELQTLRETYNSKQDAWIKEKLDMQEQLRELEEKLARGGGDSWNIEKSRLKDLLEEKSSELDQTKHEVDVLNDQNSYLRKDSEDLRRKLEDYEKVAKIQRTMSADTSALDKEIKELKSKILQEEKSHKAEVAQLKMRYDSRVALISEELQSLQNQVAKFKRERDSTRHMLEAAQKTIGELRNATGGKNTPTHANISPEDESEETRTKLASLEQQLGCMEDELSDARLEASKLKTELVSERSAWEVKLSEMQSRLNELEEDRLMSSGRMKIPGMRTRMELAWQKERDEQHRLLQETSTLARDLRQTLFEVERERDKERLDGKRKLDQLKKNMEEEMEENRKKITEMQYDLLELRDAHAKLRTTNEKLRRERERWEKDRDEQRQQAASRKRQELDEERKINSLLEQVEELMKLAPELFPQRKASVDSSLSLPVAPKRTKGPKSRESSPGVERRDYSREPSMGVDDRKQHLHSTLSRLTEATNELRKYQRMGEEEKDRERARRTLGFRRAASTEAEPQPEGQNKTRNTKTNGSSSKKGGLFRKSLSLEQTSGGMNQDQNIWTGDNDGSMNSLQSLDAGAEAMDARFLNMQRRDPSVDRLSTDSTQSETTEKKKKKGLLGKLTKKLTKSRSIEDTNTGDYVLTAGMQAAGSIGGSGSDISVDISTAGTGKKDIKDRIVGMFKKSSSRSSSVERSSVDREAAPPPISDRSESLQRPLKGANNAAMLRPSPARSDASISSSASRPLAPTVTPKPATPAASATARSRYFR